MGSEVANGASRALAAKRSATGGVGILVTLLATACGTGPTYPLTTRATQAAMPSPQVTSATIQWDDHHRLDPPPANAAPAVSADEALQRCGHGAVCAKPYTSVDRYLGAFYDDVYGRSTNGSGHPAFQGVLAWALVFHGVPAPSDVGPAPVFSNAPSFTPPAAHSCSYFVSVIDATTGQFLEAFSAC